MTTQLIAAIKRAHGAAVQAYSFAPMSYTHEAVRECLFAEQAIIREPDWIAESLAWTTWIEETDAFTDEEKAMAAEREVRQRRRVYARLVGEGRLKPDQADYQIAIMEAIAADYRAKAELPL